MRNAAVVMVMVFAAVPAFADQAAKNPYRNLFRAQELLKEAQATQRSKPAPTVVCGMTIIPADPSIDPKMAIAPKKDGIEPKIRAIEPPVCNAAK